MVKIIFVSTQKLTSKNSIKSNAHIPNRIISIEDPAGKIGRSVV